MPSNEAKDFVSPFYIGSFYVKNVENGVRAFPNLYIGCVIAEKCERYAVQDRESTDAGSHARIDEVHIINCCKGKPEPAIPFLTGYMERWDIGTLYAEDNEENMTYALEAWGENNGGSWHDQSHRGENGCISRGVGSPSACRSAHRTRRGGVFRYQRSHGFRWDSYHDEHHSADGDRFHCGSNGESQGTQSGIICN